MSKGTVLAGLALGCMLVGSLDASEVLPTAHFKCGKVHVMADFHDETQLDLTIGNKTYLLSVAMSGSGARYETPKGAEPYVLFWNKGREATIQVNDESLPLCHQVDAPIHPLLTQNKEWEVIKINDIGLIKGSRLELTLTNKAEIKGFSGCNHFSGHYELKGEDITFKGPMASTEMACVDESMMKQESDFMKILQSVTHAKIFDGKDLILSNDKGQSITLSTKK